MHSPQDISNPGMWKLLNLCFTISPQPQHWLHWTMLISHMGVNVNHLTRLLDLDQVCILFPIMYSAKISNFFMCLSSSFTYPILISSCPKFSNSFFLIIYQNKSGLSTINFSNEFVFHALVERSSYLCSLAL